MNIHWDEAGFAYNDEGVLITSEPSLVDSIFDANNSLAVRARIKRDPIAMYFYARIIDDDYCRYREAVEYYKEAVKAGVVPAAYNLAMCYLAGDGVEKNVEEAADLLRWAAERGNPSSQFKLGMLYDLGTLGLKSAMQAFFYYKDAAKANHPIAQNNLAYCYCNGDGVSRDIQEAARWYKASAENGYKPAQQWCIQYGVHFSAPTKIAEIITDSYTMVFK